MTPLPLDEAALDRWLDSVNSMEVWPVEARIVADQARAALALAAQVERLREMFVTGVPGGWPDDDALVPRGWETWRLLLHGEECGDVLDGEAAWEHFQRGLESPAILAAAAQDAKEGGR